MNPAPVPANQGSNALAWVGLLFGFLILGLIVWDNAAAFFHRGPHESNPNVIELTSANWQKEVLESRIPVVVDFWAPWCGPCLRFSPTLDKIAELYPGRVKFGKLNIDNAEAIAAKYRIESIPHVIVFKKGAFAAPPIGGRELSERKLTTVIEDVLRSN